MELLNFWINFCGFSVNFTMFGDLKRKKISNDIYFYLKNDACSLRMCVFFGIVIKYSKIHSIYLGFWTFASDPVYCVTFNWINVIQNWAIKFMNTQFVITEHFYWTTYFINYHSRDLKPKTSTVRCSDHIKNCSLFFICWSFGALTFIFRSPNFIVCTLCQ